MSNLDTQDLVLAANVPRRIGMVGRKFCIMESSARVTVKLLDLQGQEIGRATGVLDGIDVGMPRDFFTIVLESTVAQSIKIACASEDVRFNRVSGNVSATITQASTISQPAAITVGVAEVLAKAASSAHIAATYTNDAASPGDVALIVQGGALADAAIVLEPGESYTDNVAAAAERYAIASAAGCTLRVEICS